ncbi:hypothetical protein ACQFX9_29980 [Aliinostoc sp. HNIBRCY26]|uniref:hypothetical protein n=1 Tax=Aliinostoc sp. HNIBRCY26 TaxID=3418997 RepID=UPI003CFC3454
MTCGRNTDQGYGRVVGVVRSPDLVGWVEERNPTLSTPNKYVDLLGFTIVLPNLPFIQSQYHH